MFTRTSSLVLLAPFAFACSEFASEEEAFSFAAEGSVVGETSTAAPGGWQDTSLDVDSASAPAPLVASGIWEMQVTKALGPACWPGIEAGQSATVQVDSTEAAVTLMGFVTTKMPDPGELVGSGSRTSQNEDGCKRVETLYIEASLDDTTSMAAYMELTIEHVGEGCSLSKTPLVDCSTAWAADLWSQEGKAGTAQD